MNTHRNDVLQSILREHLVDRQAMELIFKCDMMSGEQLAAALLSATTQQNARSSAASLLMNVGLTEKIEILDAIVFGHNSVESSRQMVKEVLSREGIGGALLRNELMIDAMALNILAFWREMANALESLTHVSADITLSIKEGPDADWIEGTSPTTEGQRFQKEAIGLGACNDFFHARVGDVWYDSAQLETLFGTLFLLRKTHLTSDAKEAS